MQRRKEFTTDVSDLLVADSAKSVIEGFLDAECSPTIALSPSRAERIKNIILREIHLSLSDTSPLYQDEQMLNKNTAILAKKLRAVAKGYCRVGEMFFWNRFRVLSELINYVIPPGLHHH